MTPRPLVPFRARIAAPFRPWCSLLVALLVCHFAVSLPAQEAPAKTGVIEGRVFNAISGLYLNNARVTVEGTAIEVFTDDTGSYRLRNLPAGPAVLKVAFAGQNDLIERVTVEPGATLNRDFTFNADQATVDKETGAIKLNPFVVESARYRNAQEIAINEERASTNIKSVVALDSLGYISDGNVGEFVKFMPGVDVGYGSAGSNSNPDNATSVGVRGFGADTTAILVDGVPISSASPSSLTRAVQLDGVSINNATRLEIIKVATPDMRQDSPGGAINLVTRGAFEYKRPTYNLSVAFNGNTNQLDFKPTAGPGGESTYKIRPSVRFSSTIPVRHNLGVSVSVSHDSKASITRTSSPNIVRTNTVINLSGLGGSSTYAINNAAGTVNISNPVFQRMTLNDNQWIDDRSSANLRVDWRPTPYLELRVNGQFSNMETTGIDRRNQFNINAIQDWGETYTKGFQGRAAAPGVTAYNPGHRAEMTIVSRDKTGFTSQGYLTAKFERGPWTIDAKVTASESFHALDDRKKGHLSGLDNVLSPARMDFTGVNKGAAGQILMWDINGAPLDYSRMNVWNLASDLQVQSGEAYNRDLTKQYQLDVTHRFDLLPFPVVFKSGAFRNTKSNHKWGRGSNWKWRYIGPTLNARSVESDYASEPIFGYQAPQYWVDTTKLYELFKANPAHFDENWASGTVNLAANNYNSRIGQTKGLTETSDEWYGMATANLLNNRLTIVTGARQSRKAVEGYNLFNDGTYMYVKMPDGTLYRDSVYTNGVRYDGGNNNYATGDARRARDVILTDAALRARMLAAGVRYLPTQLELAPNGTSNGTRENNIHFAPLGRYTRNIDSAQTQPWTPQVQVAYDITENIRAQLAWSQETRNPDLEGSNQTLLSGGANFSVNSATTPTSDLGGDGTIAIANVKGTPERNQSYNFKLGYYPRSGSYSISYYYKVVKNAWVDTVTFNTDSDYDELLAAMGLERADYANYAITTTTATGEKAVRKGFEVDLRQNLSVLGNWGKRVDVFLTYTRRPVTAATASSNPPLGWLAQLPVRAKWTGGLSYSANRYSIQARWTYLESGITRSGSGTNVTMPDGTTRSVQLYNLNSNPVNLNLQANYVLNRQVRLFAVANRLLERRTTARTTDAVTGLSPGWASWNQTADRGITLSAGMEMKF